MGHADHGSFNDPGDAHGLVFQIDRRNPLAAGLDNVLGAVDQLQDVIFIQRGDVAGVEPAFLGEGLIVGVVVVVVAGDDPRPAHHEVPACGAVVGLGLLVIVDDAHVDAEHPVALLLLHLKLLFGAGRAHQVRRQHARRAQRAHFGHAPGVDDVGLVVVFELADHGAGRG